MTLRLARPLYNENDMSKQLTRRQWTATLTVAASIPALAQSRPGDNPTDLLTQARQLQESHRKALSAFKLDRCVEPAFHFEA